jgi:hypothetical protein
MDLHEQRDINQFNLATFAFDAHNRLDYATDQTINQLKDENEKAGQKYTEMEKMKAENPAKWKDLEEKVERMDINLDSQVDGYMIDIFYRTEEMVAIMEMKIIYAYKHLEINIKKLLSAAYPETNKRDFYKWEILIAFLKSKGIQPEELNGYREVKQLREVNNAAKHTDNIQNVLQHIDEFKGHNYISFEDLESFYHRVKGAPNNFLTALTGAIYKEIYSFDNSKIKMIAESIVLRMDKDQALQLTSAITAYYE